MHKNTSIQGIISRYQNPSFIFNDLMPINFYPPLVTLIIKYLCCMHMLGYEIPDFQTLSSFHASAVASFHSLIQYFARKDMKARMEKSCVRLW